MGRGPSLKSQKKRAHDLAYAEEKGRLDAQLKAHQKKPLEESFKEHLGKLIDTLDADAIVKVMAVGTLAYVLYPIVKTIPEVIKFELEHPASGAVQQFANSIVLFLTGVPEKAPETAEEQVINMTTSVALSIGIAALIVQFGPAILESVGGVGGLARLFLIA